MSAPLSVKLRRQERRRLQRALAKAKDVRYFRALQGILWRAAGVQVQQVADHTGVTRQQVWNWVRTYLDTRQERALRPTPSPGRPRVTDGTHAAQLIEGIESDPQPLGYHATSWTVPMLQHYLAEEDLPLSQRTLRRLLHQLGYCWKRPRYVLARRDPRWKQKRRYLRWRIRQIRREHPNAVILFVDETTLREFPPLRACWGRKGQPVDIEITGHNAKRVLFGAFNYRTGHRITLARERNGNQDFQAFLDELRRRYPGRPLYLILDKATSHRYSQDHAKTLDIKLLWLPTACPRMNPIEDLWRELKRQVAANRCYTDLEELASRAQRWLHSLTLRQALRTAGLMSNSFWLPT